MQTDEDRRQRIEELFVAVVELPEDERRPLLERECPGDSELIDEVLSLAAHDGEDFLDNPAHLRAAGMIRPEVHPSRIEAYRIERVLGQGGMGVVYLAFQGQPVRRQVALKLIKLGMDTQEVVARFAAERQALALMSHPNIAHVFDAGAAPDGRPYFVMEYVDGVPITRYCDDGRLGLDARLELFLQIADGVQHAHHKGIIHRDLKPSNVLVALQDGRPVPKIIDFGIAKATESHLTGVTVHTEIGHRVGTPEYMSPEQVGLHDDVDTRSDVYSLGVLLYVLLTGVLPIEAEELRSGGYEALCRRIRELEPPRPSARLAALAHSASENAERRGLDTPTLIRHLRGDLDWIVLRAIEKERDRRYQSVSELAADIQRHLADEPVVARPPRALYRAGKFVRRHRVGVAAAAVVLVALLLGLAGTAMGLVRARRAERVALAEAARANVEARTSERVADYVVRVFEQSDPSAARGNEITVREVLDAQASKIKDELEDEPRFQGRVLLVMGKVYRGLGQNDVALSLLEDALAALREAHGIDHLEIVDSLNEIGNTHVKRGAGEMAEPHYREALAMAERLVGPDDPSVASILKNLGDIAARRDDLAEARAYHERALDIRTRHFGADSDRVAISLSSVADVLVRSGDYAAAIPILTRALQLRKKSYPPDHPRLGYGYFFLGNALLEAGSPSEAVPHFRAAAAIWDKALGPDHGDLSECLLRLGQALQASGDSDGAREALTRSLEMERRLGGGDEAIAERERALATTGRQNGETTARVTN